MRLSLFEAVGIELEYMIVDAQTLSVAPLADRLLTDADGEVACEVEHGEVAWSNELALHVIEIKTNGPTKNLAAAGHAISKSVREMNALLATSNAKLMPAGMHPWMVPQRELLLWPHEHRAVYEAFHRVFGCGTHGFANLQSMHLNLPFADDNEFGRLHAAIRLLLPILPALAASSPLLEGTRTGCLDNRLDAYRSNCARIPSVTGRVIPEPVYTRDSYQRQILERIYHDVAPFDPDAVLRDEWLNARGAIARFSRGSIEIRVLDTQENPISDLAIAEATVAGLMALVAERWSSFDEQRVMGAARLESLFLKCIIAADEAVITDAEYLRLFGFPGPRATAGELWHHLTESTRQDNPAPADAELRRALAVVLNRGPLARRLVRNLSETPRREEIAEVYGELCACLQETRPFVA